MRPVAAATATQQYHIVGAKSKSLAGVGIDISIIAGPRRAARNQQSGGCNALAGNTMQLRVVAGTDAARDSDDAAGAYRLACSGLNDCSIGSAYGPTQNEDPARSGKVLETRGGFQACKVKCAGIGAILIRLNQNVGGVRYGLVDAGGNQCAVVAGAPPTCENLDIARSRVYGLVSASGDAGVIVAV